MLRGLLEFSCFSYYEMEAKSEDLRQFPVFGVCRTSNEQAMTTVCSPGLQTGSLENAFLFFFPQRQLAPWQAL